MTEFIVLTAILLGGAAVAWTVGSVIMLARSLGDMEDIWHDDDEW